MKVFLTGGSGFLGSHVAERLVSEGHEVHALVRATSGVRHLQSIGCHLETVRLDDPAGLERALAGVEAIIHCAGLVKANRPEDLYRVNGQGTRNLVRAAAALGAAGRLKRIVCVSSIAAQGPSDGPDPRPEEAEPRPVSLYGKSKLEGEREALSLADRIPVTIVRPPVIYGPRDKEMLPVFQSASRGLLPVIGDGRNLLTVIHAEDVARALLDTITREHRSGSIFTISDGSVYEWREFFETLTRVLGTRVRQIKVPLGILAAAATLSGLFGRLTGKAVIFTPDKVAEMRQRYWSFGHRAITEAVGWRPRIALEDGLRSTLEWYRKESWMR